MVLLERDSFNSFTLRTDRHLVHAFEICTISSKPVADFVTGSLHTILGMSLPLSTAEQRSCDPCMSIAKYGLFL